MRNSKFKWVAPLLTLVFAVGAAFATNSTREVETSAPVPGYIDWDRPCKMAIECSDVVGPVCKDGTGQQVFGKKNKNDTTCSEEVFQLIL